MADDGGPGLEQLSNENADILAKANPVTCSITVNQLKSFIEGEVYTALRCHFFKQGKGRRPDLPYFEKLTNGLLLQLFFLKEEKGTTYRELQTWFHKLLPATVSIATESKIYHRINSLLDKCCNLPEVELPTCLNEECKFVDIPQALVTLGITDLEPISFHLPSIPDVCNEVVVLLSHIASKENRPASFVRKWLVRLSLACANISDDKLRRCVKKCLDKYNTLSKRKKIDEFEKFANSLFIAGGEQSQNEMAKASVEVQDKNVENKKRKCLNCDQFLDQLKEKENQIVEKDRQLEEKDKQLCERNDLIRELEENLKGVEWDKSGLKKTLKGLEMELSEVKKNKLYYKRNTTLREENVELNLAVTDLTTKLECAKTEKENVHKELKRKLKTEQTLKSKYKKQSSQLKEEREAVMFTLNDVNLTEQSTLVQIKGNKNNMYSNHIRQLYMALQGEANVASTQATKSVMLVAKHLFNKDFELNELPCPRTCLNFMYEGNHIMQAANC